MKAQIHFRDALAWMAKAPPMPAFNEVETRGVVIPFPLERVRQHRMGLAGGVS